MESGNPCIVVYRYKCIQNDMLHFEVCTILGFIRFTLVSLSQLKNLCTNVYVPVIGVDPGGSGGQSPPPPPPQEK